MKAHVYVVSKRTVLDPQGQAIQNALRKLGHADVTDVRQGKYFILTLDDSLDGAAAHSEVERIASEVLCNPVMEEFSFQID
ncbi:phosphoribosylformylglycinamidine synthase subunit PurS [Acidipila sp. EB88]|uniref:phosphoribosylformylglycinamidine synthase subunit PurS n=1 Tax=Acidipila sp. EB88 TaxID=2305226 RepID=UPI000F5D6E94|nr:phosphoribosylformylglycinamidine synthase subunit PurS [Acidipila sp. EB88]RRA47973.1 phosphoribosylformylglycinamidine synthase subunit PurS [Acidipila sp. EB88]